MKKVIHREFIDTAKKPCYNIINMITAPVVTFLVAARAVFVI